MSNIGLWMTFVPKRVRKTIFCEERVLKFFLLRNMMSFRCTKNSWISAFAVASFLLDIVLYCNCNCNYQLLKYSPKISSSQIQNLRFGPKRCVKIEHFTPWIEQKSKFDVCHSFIAFRVVIQYLSAAQYQIS